MVAELNLYTSNDIPTTCGDLKAIVKDMADGSYTPASGNTTTWKEKEIFVPTKRDKFKKEMMNLLNRYKLYHVIKMMEDNFVQIKNTHNDDVETLNDLQTKHIQYMQLQMQLCKLLGTTITR